jgi:arylsulfatase A-like enzyme
VRLPLTWLALLALLAALLVPATAASAQAGPRPNVLVIQTDDQTLESMRVMPNVRRLLAAQGVTFANSFVSLSECCPSRATLLTGQYAHNHGVLSNHHPSGGYYKLNNANTLAVWLRRSGYYTAMVGKYLNEYGNRGQSEVPPGWSEWYVRSDNPSYYDYTINHNGRLSKVGGAPADYSTDRFARHTITLLRARARSRQPFFIYTGFFAPHGATPPERERYLSGLDAPIPARRHLGRYDRVPLPRPPSFNETNIADKPESISEQELIPADRVAAITRGYRRQLESLLAVDEAVRSIVTTLSQTRQLGRTMIVFTSDNGFINGEHRIPDGKLLPYEPSIRVPLIVRGPGVPRGQVRRQLVANVDLAPTIAAVARARPGRVMDGLSLMGFIRQAGRVSTRSILLESGVRVQEENQFAGIRTSRYTYVEFANGERELYDNLRDRHQLVNQAANRAMSAARAGLARRLAVLRKCRGASCRGA